MFFDMIVHNKYHFYDASFVANELKGMYHDNNQKRAVYCVENKGMYVD